MEGDRRTDAKCITFVTYNLVINLITYEPVYDAMDFSQSIWVL